MGQFPVDRLKRNKNVLFQSVLLGRWRIQNVLSEISFIKKNTQFKTFYQKSILTGKSGYKNVGTFCLELSRIEWTGIATEHRSSDFRRLFEMSRTNCHSYFSEEILLGRQASHWLVERRSGDDILK
jgi:hypothetical protein